MWMKYPSSINICEEALGQSPRNIYIYSMNNWRFLDR